MRRWTGTLVVLLWKPLLRFFRDGGSQYAGNVAFFTLMSLFPFLIFLTTIAASFQNTPAAERFIHYLLETLPPLAAASVEPIVEGITTQKDNLFLTLSIVVILWSAANGIEALRDGLNMVYGVKRPRSFLFRRFQGMVLVLVAVVAILLAANALILLPIVLSYLPLDAAWFESVKPVISLGRFGIAPVLLFISTMILYRFLPNVDHGWRQVWPGAALSVVLWLVLMQLFALYVRNFGNFSVIYGSLGGVIVLMLLLYLSAAAILLGAQFNAVLFERLQDEEAP